MEERKGWVRITKPYDANCEGGKSLYVDAGLAACTAKNGIVDGQFAEWVEKAKLSKVQPADPALTATLDETVIAQSDDFERHRRGFAKLAKKLIGDGRCTEADLREQGGFVKSVDQYRNQPVYFTYCGGTSLSNKIYVNAVTGEILP